MNLFLFSIGINTAYFLADLFIKLGSNQRSAGNLVYHRSVYTVAMTFLWLLLSGSIENPPQLTESLQLIGCGTFCVLGLYFYVKALQGLHFVNVSVVGITGALIHYLLGVFINNENFNAWFYVAALLCIVGIAIQWRKQSQHKGILAACLSAVFWGFGYALLNIPLQKADAVWGAFILEVCALILSGAFIFRFEPSFKLRKSIQYDHHLLLVAFFTILGSVWINYAYQKFNLSALGFMQLAFFPYAMLAGYFIFKERLSKLEWIGNSLVMAGLAVYYVFI